MTPKPTNLAPPYLLWEEPTWQMVKVCDIGPFNSRYIQHMNSVLVHRCDKVNINETLRPSGSVPRTYIVNLYQLKYGCNYCGGTPSADMQTIWTLHNADCFDNTRTQ
jgi:hypothetical protein